MEFEEKLTDAENFTLSSMLAKVSDLKKGKEKLRLYIKGLIKKEHPNFEEAVKLANRSGFWEIEGDERVEILEVNYVSDSGDVHKMSYRRFSELGKKYEITVQQNQRTTYK